MPKCATKKQRATTNNGNAQSEPNRSTKSILGPTTLNKLSLPKITKKRKFKPCSSFSNTLQFPYFQTIQCCAICFFFKMI